MATSDIMLDEVSQFRLIVPLLTLTTLLSLTSERSSLPSGCMDKSDYPVLQTPFLLTPPDKFCTIGNLTCTHCVS